MALPIDSFPGRTLTLNGKEHLYFGGTAYLGLQDLPEFQELFIKNIRKYGTNYGASRKSNVQFSVFKTAEEHLAGLVGSEACLSLSSGYLAGQLLSKYMHNSAYKPFYAPNTHAALFQNKIKTYVTYASLNIAIRNYIKEPNAKTPVLFMDTIDFCGGNYPEFENLSSLPLKDMVLVADDSHGIGIIGNNGGGAYRLLRQLQPKQLLVCSSLGKGFGVQAGAIFGDTIEVESMENTSFYGGSSPASPAAMATFLEAEALYNSRRILLHRNLAYFKNEVDNLKRYRYMEGHPTFTFLNEALISHLENHGIVVTNFNYPKDNSDIMSRIVLSASHTLDDMDVLIHALNGFGA